jgi:hypothetical protein
VVDEVRGAEAKQTLQRETKDDVGLMRGRVPEKAWCSAQGI